MALPPLSSGSGGKDNAAGPQKDHGSRGQHHGLSCRLHAALARWWGCPAGCILWMCLSAAGLCWSSQTPFSTGTMRTDTTAEQKTDFALQSEPHCGSRSVHTVLAATEIPHQAMWCAHRCEPQSGSWSDVRVSSLFLHTELVPVEYSVGLGGAACPLMLLVSEPGFHARWRLSWVCQLPGSEGFLFLCV